MIWRIESVDEVAGMDGPSMHILASAHLGDGEYAPCVKMIIGKDQLAKLVQAGSPPDLRTSSSGNRHYIFNPGLGMSESKR